MSTDLLERKFCDAGVIKSDAATGYVTCIANSTGVVDAQGDLMLPGCYATVIKSGDRPSLCWSHDTTKILGHVTSMTEMFPGDPRLPKADPRVGALVVTSKFNLETQDGREAFSKVREKDVKEWSVCVLVHNDDADLDQRTGVRRVKNVTRLVELSPVLMGASPFTQTLLAKRYPGRLPASFTELRDHAYDLAYDRAFLAIAESEREEARELNRRQAVAEGLAVAAETLKESIARAKQVQEIERMAGIAGNYSRVRPARQLAAEEERVIAIEKMAGTHGYHFHSGTPQPQSQPMTGLL